MVSLQLRGLLYKSYSESTLPVHSKPDRLNVNETVEKHKNRKKGVLPKAKQHITFGNIVRYMDTRTAGQ